MSAVQSNIDVGMTKLTPELRKQAESNSASYVNDSVKVKEAKEIKTVELTDKDKKLEENRELTTEQLDKVAQQLQDFVGEMNTGLEFLVDKDSGRDVIKVIDKSSGDLVKQYPSEEVLSLVAKLSDMVGGFVDAKV